MALTNKSVRARDRAEVILLLLSAPALLFPNLVPLATALALAFIAAIWLLRGPATSAYLLRTPFNTSLLVWLLAVLSAVLVSADPQLTLPKVTGLLLGVSLWRTLVVQVRTTRDYRIAVGLFLAVAALLLAIGAASTNWQSKFALFETLVQPWPVSLRMPGASAGVHPNELAGTVLLCWPMSLALLANALCRDKQPTHRWLVVLAAFVSVGGAFLLLVTQSRGGWIGGVAGIGALLWLHRAQRTQWTARARRRALATGVLALFSAIIVLLVLFPWLSSEALVGEPGSLETIGFRFEVWQYAVEAISDFPLTGPGLGTFRQVVLRLYPITAFPSPDIGHAHNVFLQMALDTGLPGLVAYVALLLLVGAVGWRRLNAGEAEDTAPAIGVLATLLGFHIFGLTDTVATGAKPGLLFWWLLALLAAPKTMAIIHTPAGSGLRRDAREQDNGVLLNAPFDRLMDSRRSRD